jgi:hypothetical protein
MSGTSQLQSNKEHKNTKSEKHKKPAVFSSRRIQKLPATHPGRLRSNYPRNLSEKIARERTFRILAHRKTGRKRVAQIYAERAARYAGDISDCEYN